jgi:hypothetical protein
VYQAIVNWLSCLLQFIILALSAYGLYLLFVWNQDVGPVLVFGQGEASLKEVHLDEVIIFYQPIKKFRSCPGMSQRILLGDCGYHVVSEVNTYLPAPFDGRITLPVKIPHYAIPGNCNFMILTKFVCNPLDLVKTPRIYQSPRIPFKVLRYDQ